MLNKDARYAIYKGIIIGFFIFSAIYSVKSYNGLKNMSANQQKIYCSITNNNVFCLKQ